MSSEPAHKQSERMLSKGELKAFVNYASVNKKHSKNWVFVHAQIKNPEAYALVDEVAQVVDFSFQKDEARILTLPNSGEVFVIAENKEKKPLLMIEKIISSTLDDDSVSVNASNLNESGIELLTKSLMVNAPPSDRMSKIGMLRLARMSNVFMVLDDDAMVLKQMEKILSPLGHVECMPAVEDFIPSYERFAPNVVFLDINLRREKGTDVARALVLMVDPFAHIVMISSDAYENNVNESKDKGAKSFIVKPINRDLVLKHAMAAPTFCPRLTT